MKMIKTIFVAIVVCAATALIAMAGTCPATKWGDSKYLQVQTATQLPEIVPAIPIESITMDRIFQ
jgi:hypothetical protein